MKQEQIDEIRDFNRFYAKVIGLLDKTFLNSEYSLTEVRVLLEIYKQSGILANDIMNSLQIDKGYLSRILKKFEKKQMITKKQSDTDRRAIYLELTEFGKKEFLEVDTATNLQIDTIFSHFSEAEQQTLIENMNKIKNILQKK
ncbi:MAG: MarR family transcriptional regulator [Cytophagales bacterium]|nr:MAG: MarR family transcriptional regulator [Cytophagales bacterium]